MGVNIISVMELCASHVSPVFKSFIRELVRLPPRGYHNKKDTIQSSVGMVFKLHSSSNISSIQDVLKSNYHNIQLLFTQRAGYEKDRNACKTGRMQTTWCCRGDSATIKRVTLRRARGSCMRRYS